MEYKEPPIKPTTEITQSANHQRKFINRTLPLKREQKSKLEQELELLKEELSLYQIKINHQERKLKSLQQSVITVKKDQALSNNTFKERINELDSEQLTVDQSIVLLAETSTTLEEIIDENKQKIVTLEKTTKQLLSRLDEINTKLEKSQANWILSTITASTLVLLIWLWSSRYR